MTPELAALLDGPVAERFERPTAMGGLSLRSAPSGAMVWASAAPDESFRAVPDEVASALWLAHLLDGCRDRGWSVAFLSPNLARSFGVEIAIRRAIGNQVIAAESWASRLESLSRAMLAVPA